jgi:23S rRNA pseudouridine1911/1915/1917 synthase
MPEQTLTFQISAAHDKHRLDRFLYDQIGAVSRMFLRDLIEQEFCTVNGESKPRGYHLQENDSIEITFDADAATAMTPENIRLEIVFEDDEILIVNKSAGMLVHPTKHVKTGTLANALAFHLNGNQAKIVRPGIVHRLDKETSGLMIVAKNARALRILSAHFQKKLIKKLYAAIVETIIFENSGTISAPIGRGEEKPHWRVSADGKEAETRFRVLERGENSTLLELEPVTGRTNQLRIHCAHLGHPIVGDEWYGAKPYSRLCLHAARLGFYHPNGGWLEFSTALPPEFSVS